MTKQIRHAKQEHRYYPPIALQVNIPNFDNVVLLTNSEASEMILALDRVCSKFVPHCMEINRKMKQNRFAQATRKQRCAKSFGRKCFAGLKQQQN